MYLNIIIKVCLYLQYLAAKQRLLTSWRDITNAYILQLYSSFFLRTIFAIIAIEMLPRKYCFLYAHIDSLEIYSRKFYCFPYLYKQMLLFFWEMSSTFWTSDLPHFILFCTRPHVITIAYVQRRKHERKAKKFLDFYWSLKWCIGKIFSCKKDSLLVNCIYIVCELLLK